jgi:hypothetical protein
LAFVSRAGPDDGVMATRTPTYLVTDTSSDGCPDRTGVESPEHGPISHRLDRYTAWLGDAVRAQDLLRAHRWACELRDLGWSAALPGPAAMAGVLAMRLSDKNVSPGEIDLALDETSAEVHRAISRMT